MIRYVKTKWTAPLFRNVTGDEKRLDLLWGDRVRVINQDASRWQVKARGVEGFISPSNLGQTSYLEFYFIDVGQGDGILIRTPDDRHIMIDGGWPRRGQPSGKNAADFVDWKFFEDYEMSAIKLDAMICSHNDQDHYGGSWDLLDVAQNAELDTSEVFIENFYHAGLSWWKGAERNLGPSTPDGKLWTRLLEDRTSIVDGLKTSGSQPKLQGEWAEFLSKVVQAKTASGAPTPALRLSDKVGHLPGFGPNGEVRIRIFAPVEFTVGGKPAVHRFSADESQNTNGNSILLRVDYKDVRVLLTGDLNTKSQQSLLADYQGQEEVFKCDVAKACHHGSGDVSITFLEKVRPAATIISSGDSEGHDHPRPNIIAASGLTGHKSISGDSLLTPLVFSTELARSVALGELNQLDKLDAQDAVVEEIRGDGLGQYRTRYEVTMSGDRNPKKHTGNLGRQRLVHRTTYGLINVRTDGENIMFAALNEKEFKWNVTAIKTRFPES